MSCLIIVSKIDLFYLMVIGVIGNNGVHVRKLFAREVREDGTGVQ